MGPDYTGFVFDQVVASVIPADSERWGKMSHLMEVTAAMTEDAAARAIASSQKTEFVVRAGYNSENDHKSRLVVSPISDSSTVELNIHSYKMRHRRRRDCRSGK